MLKSFFRRYKTTILYGAGLALLLFILHWLEWRFIVFDHAMDLYTVGVAILFTGLGIWLALKLARPKVITITRPAPPAENGQHAAAASDPAAIAGPPENGQHAASAPDPAAIAGPAANGLHAATPDPTAIARLGLSTRELEVLQGMAEGLSNQEIADKLFVSLNTIKTHSSRIFEKLDARRRTQAVDTARRLRVIT